MNTIVTEHAKWKTHNYILLLIGTLLLFLTHVRFGIQILSWFVYVPYFLYLKRTKGIGSFLLFSLVLFTGWSLAILKIMTDPLAWYFALIFSLPITMFHLLGYSTIRIFKDNKYWWLITAGSLTIAEWLLGALTPFGTWGTLAYAKLDDLALIQLSSLFGITAVSLLLLTVNGLITNAFHKGLNKSFIIKNVTPIIIVLLLVYSFGYLRISIYEGQEKSTIRVATIDHDTSGFSLDPQNNAEYAKKSQEANIALTIDAANAGAKIIAWMEGSTMVLPENERAWQERLSTIAKSNDIHLVAAYVTPLDGEPVKLANKIVWFKPDGRVDHEYEKNVPVPSEPVRKGEIPPQAVVDKGNIYSAAICYDYDFPRIANHIGRLNAGLVVLPSGDWRGIDPLHSQMSAFRAIENGHSIVRPVNSGLHSTVSPVGRILSWRSDFDTEAGFLLSDVPTEKLTTLYTYIGEWSILLPFILILVSYTFGRKRKL